jgi:hypothetical protein
MNEKIDENLPSPWNGYKNRFRGFSMHNDCFKRVSSYFHGLMHQNSLTNGLEIPDFYVFSHFFAKKNSIPTSQVPDVFADEARAKVENVLVMYFWDEFVTQS